MRRRDRGAFGSCGNEPKCSSIQQRKSMSPRFSYSICVRGEDYSSTSVKKGGKRHDDTGPIALQVKKLRFGIIKKKKFVLRELCLPIWLGENLNFINIAK